eukprot:m.19152 g.19152  ORF g.19152 m.19152 type:complete len:203 (+) comp5074_c0_seq1:185-793(+)
MTSTGGAKKVITFVTGNANKLKEVTQILKTGGITFPIVNNPVDLPEFQGDPCFVAAEKCKIAFEHVQAPVLVEDTSLCFNALNGLPGVYIKWFLTSVGHDGLNRMLAGFEDKTAYAQCIFAFKPSAEVDPILFIGQTPGMIVPARGPANFGWDPVFNPEGFEETYAEMENDVKNNISHRGKALQKLMEHFAANEAELQKLLE